MREVFIGIGDAAEGKVIVFCDVDKTLIGQKANISGLIDAEKTKKPNLGPMLAQHWEQRAQVLLDPNWPEFIKWIKDRAPVYALGKVSNGQYDTIQFIKWIKDRAPVYALGKVSNGQYYTIQSMEQ